MFLVACVCLSVSVITEYRTFDGIHRIWVKNWNEFEMAKIKLILTILGQFSSRHDLCLGQLSLASLRGR